LLSGQASVGDLQSITLTSSNATIETALIKNILSNYVTVMDLKAGNIDTNKFKIQSSDGSAVIDGNTMSFKDENGNVRVQIGKDANDNFTFVLYDADGQGVLIDTNGIKESSINDGLIVDRMIADKDNEYDGISADKLNVSSVIGAINKEGGLRSTSIRFDEGTQTLQEVYTKMTQSIQNASDAATTASSNASSALTASQNAANAAQRALDTLNGISTLDAFSAVLTNDSHVIRTLSDGSGADFTGCYTQINAFLGDTNVNEQCVFNQTASNGVTVSWNSTQHVATVTGMTGDTGYVDIEAIYHQGQSDEASITKRFSLTKIKDGGVGTSYSLILNSQIFKTNVAKTITTPSVISGNAYFNDGSNPKNFNGIFKVYTTTNGSDYTLYQQTLTAGNSFEFNIPRNIVGLKVELYSANGQQLLDVAYGSVIVDPQELANTLTNVSTSLHTTQNKVTKISDSVNGIDASLQSLTTKVNGISDGNLVYQTPYVTNGKNVTISAVVYKDGKDATQTFPASCFTWAKRTENGETPLGSGYSVTVDKSTYGYGGTVIGRFETPPEQGE
jgi:hypothetical protein